jgi:hypothetical protein
MENNVKTHSSPLAELTGSALITPKLVVSQCPEPNNQFPYDPASYSGDAGSKS